MDLIDKVAEIWFVTYFCWNKNTSGLGHSISIQERPGLTSVHCPLYNFKLPKMLALKFAQLYNDKTYINDFSTYTGSIQHVKLM